MEESDVWTANQSSRRRSALLCLSEARIRTAFLSRQRGRFNRHAEVVSKLPLRSLYLHTNQVPERWIHDALSVSADPTVRTGGNSCLASLNIIQNFEWPDQSPVQDTAIWSAIG